MDPITIAFLLGGVGVLALYYETLAKPPLAPANVVAAAQAAVAAASPAAKSGNPVSTSAAARMAAQAIATAADNAHVLVPIPSGVAKAIASSVTGSMGAISLDNGQGTGDN